MQKCDGCMVRIKNGMEPACVRACPVQALRLVDMDAGDEADEEASLQKLERKFWNFRREKKWHGRNAAVPFFNCFLTFRPNLTTLNEESIGMGNLSMEMVR